MEEEAGMELVEYPTAAAAADAAADAAAAAAAAAALKDLMKFFWSKQIFFKIFWKKNYSDKIFLWQKNLMTIVLEKFVFFMTKQFSYEKKKIYGKIFAYDKKFFYDKKYSWQIFFYI